MPAAPAAFWAGFWAAHGVSAAVRRLGRHAWWVGAVLVFALACGLRTAGLFQVLENAATDARARLLAHPVTSDIVIVGIDARSLTALDRWPWPRRHHAGLIRRLGDAAPHQVFLDIDFSSRSNALDDAVLESALAGWRGEPIVLPAFFQASGAARPGLHLTRPLPRFERHARLAAVNRLPGRDGLERAWRSSWSAGTERFASVIDLEGRLPVDSAIPIDFSIAPSSFERFSFVDVLEGRVPASAFEGKMVFVGATAVELNDMVPVPVHRSLPGIVVQALAVESLRAGPQRALPTWALLAALAAWTSLLAAALRRGSWRRNAALIVGALALLAAASLHLHARHRWLIEVVPFAFATAGIFLAFLLRSLDEQTWRAIAYALGLRRRDALLKSIVQSSTDCIVCIDATGTIRTANPATESLFACSARELVGTPLSRFVPGLAVASGDEPHALGLLDGRVSEWEATTAAGRAFPIELSVSRVRLHDERLYTAIARNISERKAQQRRLEHQATHDALTQLPNRAALIQRLERALVAGEAPRTMALLMLDLCRFKEVNDTLGHPVGDDVLCEVGRRFRQALGEAGYIARIGGDEFTVLVERPAPEAELAAIAQRLVDCLAQPIEVAGVSIEVGLSLGIARCPQDATDAVGLLKQADVAMFVAKRRGSPWEFYDPSLDGHSVRSLSMGGDLRAAISADALALHYQPKVHLQSGRCEGVEALLRWTHPVHGPVSPAEFIAFAETTDLIRPLTEWALRRALLDRQDWRAAGLDLRVAVNLSARLLQDSAFPARLRALLDECAAPPAALELEITESAMMADPSRALRVIAEIDRLGVPISIDDFGSGFSSLAYLRDLPIHALKLDKSFVTGLRARANDRVIVESTAQMAQALGLQTVAEGVEDEWEARFLATAGYDYGQGYHFSPALCAADCAAWDTRFNREGPRAAVPARRLAGGRRS
jgi:diguanylate cyclase (GGDEF)-like protein/PAS domain S-box-containing protein